MVEEMVSRRFYKYLKIFEKKELEEIPMRKLQNHAIDLRKKFFKKEEDISIVQNREREGSGVLEESVKKGVYSTIKITINVTGIICTEI